MSWDIYGNPLRRGHCEVHPHVHEEYPCSVCMAERKRNQQQPDYELERLNYELDQQNDYIKELTLSNKNLNAALQKVSDYNLRLENERDALVAQYNNLRMSVMANYEFELSSSHSFAAIVEIKAEAGRAGFIAGAEMWSDYGVKSRYKDDYFVDIEADADKYATKVRKGDK